MEGRDWSITLDFKRRTHCTRQDQLASWYVFSLPNTIPDGSSDFLLISIDMTFDFVKEIEL